MFCTDIPAPIFLIFSDTTPHLLYYSHLPAVLASLLLALLVYSRNRSLAGFSLLTIVGLFSVWNLIDLIVWTNTDSRIIMFTWSAMNLVSVLISAAMLHFSYVFLEGKDSPLWGKLLGGILLLPMIVLLSTVWNLEGFDLISCEGIQGTLMYYFYALHGIFLSWIAGYFVVRYRETKKGEERRKKLWFMLGVLFFLLSFFGGTMIGNYTGTWELEQYGLFGVFIFIGALLVMIVRYQAFDVKLLSAQALVFSLVVLIGSQFLFIDNLANQILVAITLILVMVFGTVLIRSVKLEVQQKEELQVMADLLTIANEKLQKLDSAKSEFVSIASHQLRTPLTAIKGYVSLLLEGSYGTVSAPVQDTLNKVYLVNSRLMQLVEDLLSVSRIESGRVQYHYEETQLETLVADLVDSFQFSAKKHGLTLFLKLPAEPLPKMNIDANKMKEVVSNLIDNSIKYTKEGGVAVEVERRGDRVQVLVSDTGIGIGSESLTQLFNKFVRTAETSKMEVSGTGLGLYVGKSFVEAHGGKLWAESAGSGQGSTFIVELPIRTVAVEEKATFQG